LKSLAIPFPLEIKFNLKNVGYKRISTDSTDDEIIKMVDEIMSNVDCDHGGTINYTEFLSATMNH